MIFRKIIGQTRISIMREDPGTGLCTFFQVILTAVSTHATLSCNEVGYLQVSKVFMMFSFRLMKMNLCRTALR